MKTNINRRRSLLLFAAATAIALGGCGRQDEAKPLVALEIDPRTTCDLDGMLLADYPGPKAQIHFVGVAAPMFFCDTVELFNTLLRPEQVRAIAGVFVQDMGKADWEQPRGHWIDAKTGIYVLGSKRHGSMGPTIASFAQEAEAQAFAKQWGGRVLRYAEIKPEMVDLSGGALHDSKM
ncbi:nitrous oxide reductase accessory protein NosL [Roseateles oligotrophus]|uniref:Nitrous oxide reductase accessory protein NosL n=1 Tax=Roseateles oligotrophus TaxID=1769250 RepID=A0ABT2YKL8_9BURK|nr:nitrous oxide reductase accessory protein NosL [Roseateles oligotrophus]MCV2370605.1 nitrous oxide reductase accessory protein NosL [Roseateles oligotrophus]